MRILFAGTPKIAIPSLQALANRYIVSGVLTAPDKRAGRGRKLSSPAIKVTAEKLRLTVLQPPTLDRVARNAIRALKPDLLVVFAYGKIFGPKFLDIFPSGGINMHPSALPRYRGPSPLTAAILAGEEEIALTVQNIALEMDTGDILRQTPLRLTPVETTESLTARVAQSAVDELITVIEELKSGAVTSYPQNHLSATYCRMITKKDSLINWEYSAMEIERMVRAYQPWPKAQTDFMGHSLAILEAHLAPAKFHQNTPLPGTVLGVDKAHGILIQTGNGVLGITCLQAATKTPMNYRTFLNGITIKTGMRWGEANESR